MTNLNESGVLRGELCVWERLTDLFRQLARLGAL